MTKDQLIQKLYEAFEDLWEGQDPLLYENMEQVRADLEALAKDADEPSEKPAPSTHLMTVTSEAHTHTARCSCGTWQTEVTNFGRVGDWPSDQMLADFRKWHERHLQLQVNREEPRK